MLLSSVRSCPGPTNFFHVKSGILQSSSIAFLFSKFCTAMRAHAVTIRSPSSKRSYQLDNFFQYAALPFLLSREEQNPCAERSPSCQGFLAGISMSRASVWIGHLQSLAGWPLENDGDMDMKELSLFASALYTCLALNTPSATALHSLPNRATEIPWWPSLLTPRIQDLH